LTKSNDKQYDDHLTKSDNMQVIKTASTFKITRQILSETQNTQRLETKLPTIKKVSLAKFEPGSESKKLKFFFD
jgi:hypothetical protein